MNTDNMEMTSLVVTAVFAALLILTGGQISGM